MGYGWPRSSVVVVVAGVPWVGTPAPLHRYACDDATATLVDTGSSPVNLAFLGAGTPFSLADGDGNWLWANGKKSLVLAPATHADYFGANITDIPAESSLTLLCTLRPKGGVNLGDPYQVVLSVSDGTTANSAYILVTTSVGVLSAYGGVWASGAGSNTTAKAVDPGERCTLGVSIADGGVIQFWINGVLQDIGSPTAFGGHLAAMTKIAIGGIDDGATQHSYAGRIGEVQIYDRILTGDEHRAYYASSLTI